MFVGQAQSPERLFNFCLLVEKGTGEECRKTHAWFSSCSPHSRLLHALINNELRHNYLIPLVCPLNSGNLLELALCELLCQEEWFIMLWFMVAKCWRAELQIPLWGCFFSCFRWLKKFLLRHPKCVCLEAPSPETEKISSRPLLLQRLATVTSGNVWLLCHPSGQYHTSQNGTVLYSFTLLASFTQKILQKRVQNLIQFSSSHASYIWRLERIIMVMSLEQRTSPSKFAVGPVWVRTDGRGERKCRWRRGD